MIMILKTPEIKAMVTKIIDAKKDVGGIKHVFLVGCGGSLAALHTAKIFLETEAQHVRVGHTSSNEFVHNPPKALGENALLIVCSHGGNTPETVEAGRLGKERGAVVIGMTHTPDSPITEHADYIVDYRSGGESTAPFGEDKVLQPVTIAAELLKQTEGYEHYDAYMTSLIEIDTIANNAKKHVAKRALAFAEEYKDDSLIYTMGSGAAFGAAHIESICILMEMQWINSSSIHSGEFFHGPFEVTDMNTPFIIQLSEGKTRALDERALKFLKQYAKRFEILDAKELGLSVIDAHVVSYFNQTLFTAVYNIYNNALAAARNHPLSVRRYMWKVEY